MKKGISIRQWMMLAAVPALLFVSCSKDEIAENTPDTPGSGDIRFEIGFTPRNMAQDGNSNVPQTRVTTDADFRSQWEAGDAIGLFAVESGQPLKTSGNYIHNVKLSYNGTAWTVGEELYWRDKTLDFYAYYPYSDAAIDPANIAFKVHTDQSGTTDVGGKQLSGYGQSDLLTAKTSGVSKGSPVMLTFDHALAMIQVSVPSGGKGWGPSETMTIKLKGVQTEVTLNLTGTPAAVSLMTDGGTENVKMCRVEQSGDANYFNSYTYRALIPVQTLKAGADLFLIANEGKLFNGSGTTSDLTLTAGTAETFTRSLPEMKLHTVSIKAGTFLMGSSDGSNIGDKDNSGLNTTATELKRRVEETQHKVTLTKDFRMTKYQITNAQYAKFLNEKGIGSDGKAIDGTYSGKVLVKDNGHSSWVLGLTYDSDHWKPYGDPWADNPVVYVSWYGAMAYAEWIGGSLPTEAQWEYACRAGTTTAYSFGDDAADPGDYAWYVSNSGNETRPVGTKKPNPWGLYDMHGNVWEWCRDSWDKSSYGSAAVTDPSSDSGDLRVYRGGDFKFPADFSRSARRSGSVPTFAFLKNGFRVIFYK